MNRELTDDEKEFATAMELANQGDAWAQYCVSYRYYVGQGVEKDESKGEAWLRKSAAQGCAEAQKQLDICFPAERHATPSVIEKVVSSIKKHTGWTITAAVVLCILLLMLVKFEAMLILLVAIFLSSLLGGMCALIAMSSGVDDKAVTWIFVVGTALSLLLMWSALNPGSRYSESQSSPGRGLTPQRDRDFSDALRNKRNELSR